MNTVQLSAAILLLVAGMAKAEVGLNIYGVSQHFVKCHPSACEGGKFNENNKGLSLQYIHHEGDTSYSASVGGYLDSYCQQARLAVAGVRYKLTERLYAGFDAGYINGSGFKGVGAYPVVGLKLTENVALEGLVTPWVAAAWLHLEV